MKCKAGGTQWAAGQTAARPFVPRETDTRTPLDAYLQERA